MPSKHFQSCPLCGPKLNSSPFRITALRENFYYKKYYVFWSKFILIEVIPYAAIIIFNALILAKTVKAAKFRRKFGYSGGGNRCHSEQGTPLTLSRAASRATVTASLANAATANGGNRNPGGEQGTPLALSRAATVNAAALANDAPNGGSSRCKMTVTRVRSCSRSAETVMMPQLCGGPLTNTETAAPGDLERQVGWLSC